MKNGDSKKPKSTQPEAQSNVAEPEEPDSQQDQGDKNQKRGKGKKGDKGKKRGKGRVVLITAGAVFVLLVGGGGGVYATQHSNPSFCNAICHTPMDPYVESYKENISTNPLQVDLAGPLSVTVHKDDGDVLCVECHNDGLDVQLREGLHWATGNYVYPFEGKVLTAGEAKQEGQLNGVEFCLREGCHVGVETVDELKEVLSDQTRNPHDSHNGLLNCTECHRTHEQSVMWCTQCHADAVVPDGWLTYTEQQKQIKEAEAEAE
jgi:hypothetical protein